jgi:hypothetical protein
MSCMMHFLDEVKYFLYDQRVLHPKLASFDD